MLELLFFQGSHWTKQMWLKGDVIVKVTTRIANAFFHLSAFARFPALHCLSMIQGTTHLVMDSMIELNYYYQYH